MRRKKKTKAKLIFFVANRNTTCHTYIIFLDTLNPPKLRLFLFQIVPFSKFCYEKNGTKYLVWKFFNFSHVGSFSILRHVVFFLSLEKLYKNWSDKFFLKYLSNSWKLPAVCVLPWIFFVFFSPKKQTINYYMYVCNDLICSI